MGRKEGRMDRRIEGRVKSLRNLASEEERDKFSPKSYFPSLQSNLEIEQEERDEGRERKAQRWGERIVIEYMIEKLRMKGKRENKITCVTEVRQVSPATVMQLMQSRIVMQFPIVMHFSVFSLAYKNSKKIRFSKFDSFPILEENSSLFSLSICTFLSQSHLSNAPESSWWVLLFLHPLLFLLLLSASFFLMWTFLSSHLSHFPYVDVFFPWIFTLAFYRLAPNPRWKRNGRKVKVNFCQRMDWVEEREEHFVGLHSFNSCSSLSFFFCCMFFASFLFSFFLTSFRNRHHWRHSFCLRHEKSRV